MMRDIPERGGGVLLPWYSTHDVTRILAKYLDTSTPGPLDMNLQPGIARQLMEESGIGEPQQLGLALAQHARDQLDDLEKSTAETVDWFQAVTRDETGDVEASLRMAQATNDQMWAVRTANDARALDVPVGMKHIEEWRRRGEKLESESDDLHAFAAFADLEEAFEPVEDQVVEQAMTADRDIQMQIDMARGK